MRSGVIAQKVGMTRIFTDAGEHIPVTVLRLEHCQVVGHRTSEKNGYTALQLGAGRPQGEAPEPSGAWPLCRCQCRAVGTAVEFRVSPENLIEVGGGAYCGSFRGRAAGRCDRHEHWSRFCGRYEAAQFRRPPGVAWCVGLASQSWFDRSAPRPRQGLQR